MAPKFAVDIHASQLDLTELAINFSSSGDSIVVAGTSGTIIRVWMFWFIPTAATIITFKDGSTALSGPASFSANEGMIADFVTRPWYTTSVGNNFVMNSSVGTQVSGTVYYTQENA